MGGLADSSSLTTILTEPVVKTVWRGAQFDEHSSISLLSENTLCPQNSHWDLRQFGKVDRCKMLGQGAKSDSWLTEALFSSAASHIVTRYRHDCWGQLPQLFHFCSSWSCYSPTSCHMLKEDTAHPKSKSSMALTSDYNSCGLNFHPQHYLMSRIKL